VARVCTKDENKETRRRRISSVVCVCVCVCVCGSEDEYLQLSTVYIARFCYCKRGNWRQSRVVSFQNFVNAHLVGSRRVGVVEEDKVPLPLNENDGDNDASDVAMET
jgi:hypothetical protein